MRGCLARVACTNVSLVGMRQQLEEDFSRQVAEQTMELHEQLSNRSLQEQTLRAELMDLTTHWEEEKARESEAFQQQLDGMRCYYEGVMEEREAEVDRDLTDTRFSYECEISVLRQQLMDHGPNDLHGAEMLGGLTDRYDVEMSGPPNDQCGDYGFAGRTDPFENGVVSGSVQEIAYGESEHADELIVDGTAGGTGDFVEYEASDCSQANASSEFGLGRSPNIEPGQEIAGHADQVIVDGTEWGMGDTVEYEGSECSNANIGSEFGLGHSPDIGTRRGTDDIVEYEASDCSNANISSEFGLGPDIGSDSSSVQELVGSDIESGDLQMEMRGYHEQMEHFREDSDREHLAAMSRRCAELSEDQHKTRLELEAAKCEAAREVKTAKFEAAQELEIVKCEAAQELETVKCQAAQELEAVKCQAAQESETVKCEAMEDEQDLRRELRHSFVAQLEDMRSEMLTQQNEEMENWKNTTAHNRDSRSCDQGLRSRSPTDGELIRTETGPKVATVGENIGSVVLQELQEGFESRTKIMEERHLIKLDEYQRQVDRLIGDKDEAERSRDELLEKMMADAGDSESVVADGSSRGQLREKAALRKACWKLKAKLAECSAQIKAYWHVTDTPGDKVMQEEVDNSGDAFCGGGADTEQTDSSTCQLNCVTDVTQLILDVSRDVDSLTHSVLGQQGWSHESTV